MAKIKFGAVITDSRGHIGGITYKWSKDGNVAQRLVTPTRHMSPESSTARARFSSLSRRWWSILTPTQRTAWRALAAANPRVNVWGDEFPRTGHMLYVGVNALLLQSGYPSVDTAPPSQTVTALSTLTLTTTAPETATLTFTPSPIPANHVLYVRARANFSPGILPGASAMRFLLASAEDITSPYNIGTQWTTQFGPLTQGRQQAVQAALLNSSTGALSPALIALSICT